jgi:hypothetical protein
MLGRHHHICAFSHTTDEKHRVLGSFIKDGFERGDKALDVVDPELWEDHLKRLSLGRAGDVRECPKRTLILLGAAHEISANEQHMGFHPDMTSHSRAPAHSATSTNERAARLPQPSVGAVD